MLVAPRFVLHEWELFRDRRYDELDDLLLTTYVDPFLGLAEPEDVVWQSMGEGPHARAGMEALGLAMGPAFPAQQPLSEDSLRRIRDGYRALGHRRLGRLASKSSGSGTGDARQPVLAGVTDPPDTR